MPILPKQQPPYYTTTDQTITYAQSEIILTNNQIKTLPTTGIEIIPAPGTNKLIFILNSTLIWNTTAGAYTGIDTDANVVLTFGAYEAEATTNSNMIPDNVQRITILNQPTIDDFRPSWEGYSLTYIDGLQASLMINKQIEIWATNTADFTGGNAANTLKIITNYMTIKL